MKSDHRRLQTWCGSLADTGLVTAVACRAQAGGVVSDGAAGGARAGALFDLASLTKPLTATLALVLDASGRLPLATRLGEVWSTTAPPVASWSLEDLLRHRTTLRRWMPLYATCRDEGEVAARLLAGDWRRDDAADAYSDLDYILWGLTVERVLGSSYWELLRRFVLAPLGETGFAATPDAGTAALPCALPTGREVELARGAGLTIAEQPAPARGQAQDGNSRFLGRPLGHAGVFASLPALWRLAREWSRPRRLLSGEMVDRALGGAGRFALGWYRHTETAAGRRLGPGAFGHDGFTGGTIWIDPGSDLICVALAHRASLAADLEGARATLTGSLTAGESDGTTRRGVR